MDKKFSGFKKLKKCDFDKFVKNGEIQVRSARLIPTTKVGDELSLTSVFLASLRLVKEFRRLVKKDLKMSIGGEIYVYTEVVFSKYKNCRLDGLILVVKSGEIRDVAALEMKNGNSSLDQGQIERYMDVCKEYCIPRLVTVSNEFVSEPTQNPLGIKSSKNLDLFHFSWSYLLTLSKLLLQKNNMNIEDQDQVEIMEEVVAYFEFDRSGVSSFSQMKSGWTRTVEKINAGTLLRETDQDVVEAVTSWQQEERNIALVMSKDLGVLVKSGENRFKGKFRERLQEDLKSILSKKELRSVIYVEGAVSEIEVIAHFLKRAIEMNILLKVPSDKTLKGQVGWVRKQIENCEKRNKEEFESCFKEMFIEVSIKGSKNKLRIPISQLEMIMDECRGKSIKECRIIQFRDFGKMFASKSKFVVELEKMTESFYQVIVQHLKAWTPSAPKMTREKSREDNIQVNDLELKKAIDENEEDILTYHNEDVA